MEGYCAHTQTLFSARSWSVKTDYIKAVFPKQPRRTTHPPSTHIRTAFFLLKASSQKDVFVLRALCGTPRRAGGQSRTSAAPTSPTQPPASDCNSNDTLKGMAFSSSNDTGTEESCSPTPEVETFQKQKSNGNVPVEGAGRGAWKPPEPTLAEPAALPAQCSSGSAGNS